MDTLAHEFLLLALDDTKGTSLCEDQFVLNACISAAFIGEMQFSGRLVPAAAHQFVLAPGPLSEGIMGRAEQELVGKPPGTLQKCMGWIRGFWGNVNLEGFLKGDLVRDGTLREEQDRLLFITYRHRHPAADMSRENAVADRLRHHLGTVRHEDPPCRDDALWSLIRVAKLYNVVLNQTDQQRYGALLLERTKRAPLGREAKVMADQHRAAMIAATSAATM